MMMGLVDKVNQKTMYLIAFNCTKDHQLAEDAVQESLIRIFKSAATYDSTRSLTAWVNRITRNTSLNVMRYRMRHQLFSLYNTDIAVRYPDKVANADEIEQRLRRESPLIREAIKIYLTGVEGIKIGPKFGRSRGWFSYILKRLKCG